jgi:3'(2'), 5'-bisphosphate nucleotidase
MNPSPGSKTLLDVAVDLAVAAGRAVLDHYAVTAFERKEDGSPLTLADRAAHRTIQEGLSRATPEIPLLSEESPPEEIARRREWTRFWLVDPLDGTKEFLKKSGEFTVNIALIEGGEPLLGVVHVPVSGLTYFAEKGRGAFVKAGDAAPRPIRTRALAAEETLVLASRDHGGPALEAILARVPRARRSSAGSSLKFTLLAEAKADLYVRTGRTMEWDTAAGQCVVEAAGGRVTDFAGRRLVYNKESLANPEFLAWADAGVDWARQLAQG